MATAVAARKLFTVDEYDRMATAGVFSPRERVELILGEIVTLAPIGGEHRAVVAALNRVLTRRLGDRALVWIQMSIRLGGRSEPEPDVVLVRPRRDAYRRLDPAPKDILLIIEVADTSLRWDREVKARLYAGLGVREYWIVDIVGRAIEVYWRPKGGIYRRVARVETGGSVAPRAFPDLFIRIADLFD